MKKVFTITILLFMVLTSNAQCKSVKESVDKLTGSKHLSTKNKNLNSSLSGNKGISISFSAFQESGNIFLIVNWQNNNVISISTDDILCIKLKDGEIIELKPAKSVVTKLNYIGKTPFHTILPIYEIDNNILTKISTTYIDMIRLYYQEGYVDVEATDKCNIKISEDINCLLNSINK